MRTFVSLDLEGLPATYDAETLGAVPIVEVKESDRRIDISYRFPGFFRVDREHELKGGKRHFDALDIAGVGSLVNSGKPELPSFGRYVQIPADCGYKMTFKTPRKPAKIEGVVIAPAQEKMTDGVGKHELEFDEALYASDKLYPKDMISVTGPLLIDGYNALLVHVCPFQYKPKSQQLLAYPRVDVAITLTPGASKTKTEGSAESREAFGNLFLNPGRDIGRRVNLPIGPLLPLLIGPELLIVYATPFADAAKRLAAWKNHRGLITEILEFKDDISTPAKAQAALAALKTSIRNRRSSPRSGLRYVLLMGDVDDIPTQESTLGNSTDYYCSTQTDYVPGQTIPVPWLALGRIPMRTAAEALSVVDQIVAYEKTPPTDPAYYHRFVCAGYFQTSLNSAGQAVDGRDYVFTVETIRAFLTAQGFDAERVYTCDRTITPQHPLIYKNGTPVPADVVAAIMNAPGATQRLLDTFTEGHLLIGHRDHGDVDGWYMPPLKLADLDRITGTMPSIVYSVNCLTGTFNQTTTNECFAEKLLRLPGTAPTLIASTELSNTWLNNAMILGLYDAMYGGLVPTFPGSTVSYPIRFNRFGDILNYARSYVRLVFASQGNEVLANHEMYHVLGDPSLEVWGAEPKPLRVTTKASSLAIQVELSVAAPNCVVTVWMGDQLLKRLTPTSQRFSIPLPPLPNPVPHPMPFRPFVSICAWAPGYHFTQVNVPIPQIVRPPVPVP